MRLRLLLTACLAALVAVVVAGSLVLAQALPDSGRDGRPAAPDPAVPPRPEVAVEIDGFLTWAALDRTTGRVETSPTPEATNSTESMIKPWIVADLLRRQAAAGQEPSSQILDDARAAIRDSDNDATQRLYEVGGEDRVVRRMIEMCGLDDTELFPSRWSRTEISAPDAVRLGQCLADGTAAGPAWTGWVLEQMRQVRGTTAEPDQPLPGGGSGGRWGIIDGLPQRVVDQGVAIKNGWTQIDADGNWHVNCLAITGDWVLAVLMRYPAERSLDYGAHRCASVASQVVGSEADSGLR